MYDRHVPTHNTRRSSSLNDKTPSSWDKAGIDAIQ